MTSQLQDIEDKNNKPNQGKHTVIENKNAASYVNAPPIRVLQDVFGYSDFRLLQREVINNVLSRRDTLAVMPTGGGKSLCYQIPALIFEGITIVISPLIALMQDQVSSLRENGVGTAFLNSTLSNDEWHLTARLVRSGCIKLLYISPEGINTSRMHALLHDKAVKVDCITVDEAHCISEWGHDFRPDYMAIAAFRESFPDAVLLALTATATMRVRKDIAANLNMKESTVLVSSFNRENIYLEVQPKKDKHDALSRTIDCIVSHDGECGIVYCCARRTVDEMAAELSRRGFSALGYHAGLSTDERKKRQEDFVRGRVNIMVATVAFGMGINVPNVRFVIHFDLPKSIEQYYQEIGRAGRDGLPSHALLLFSRSDASKIRHFFIDSADKAQAEALLQSMIKYCTVNVCRRQSLLAYFGENAQTGKGGTLTLHFGKNSRTVRCCDVCSKSSNKKETASNKKQIRRDDSSIVWRAISHVPQYKSKTQMLDNQTASDVLKENAVQDAVCAPISAVTVMRDVTIPVQKFLSCILRTGSRYAASYVIRVLLGRKDHRITENGHDKISTFGIGGELALWEWNILAVKTEEAGLVQREGNALALTKKALEVLHSRKDIYLSFEQGVLENFSSVKSKSPAALPSFAPRCGDHVYVHSSQQKTAHQDYSGSAEDCGELNSSESAKRSGEEGGGKAAKLSAALKAWRRQMADEENVPPYIIFGDKTIADIVQKRPLTIEEFKGVYGIGSVKAKRFGKAVVHIVQNAL